MCSFDALSIRLRRAANGGLICAAVCAVAGAAQAAVPVRVMPAPVAKQLRLPIVDPKCDRGSGQINIIDAAVEKVKTDGGYLVVTSSATYGDNDWRRVVNGLAYKHGARIVVYDGAVDSVRGELAKWMPRYTCFVVKPEEANRRYVVAVHRLTRKLDNDPYTDTIWGILTGYSATDAARIVAIIQPLVIRKGAGGTSIALEKFDEGVWYDEGKKNHGVQKNAGGVAQDIQTPDDTTKALVDTLNTYQPDYFQTSGHASERDWAPGYSYPNGVFRCKDGVLQGRDLGGNIYTVNSPNPKIYAAFGNCLIGNIPDKNCMALAWLGSGGAAQMVGYTVPTWYGYGGWGVGNYFFDQPGRFSFAEAFYLSNQALVYRLNKQYPANAKLEFDGWDGKEWGMGDYAAKLGPGDGTNNEFGLQWDRDTVAFYGDPAWRASLKPQNAGWEQTLSWKGDVYTFEIKADQDVTFGRPPAALFPSRLKLTRMLEGREYGPVISDNFIMVGGLAKVEKGKTYRVVFKAAPMGVRPVIKPVGTVTVEEKRKDVSAALGRAGDNRQELVAALRGVKPQHREAMAFLIANMPDCDLQTLGADYLVGNVTLAYRALKDAPWGERIPKDVFFNYVLPYANVNERRDDWRADFYNSFIGVADSFTSPGKAAVALNKAVFKDVDVQYHATKRPKPDQSPYESIEAGYASCTGLSVLLVDACRAVGIPARIAGIPEWVGSGGNHNWVEVWDAGKWYALGAAEPGPLGEAWFMQKARETDPSKPQNRIYAVSFKKTATHFPLVWAPGIKWVSAVDVTERYTGKHSAPVK